MTGISSFGCILAIVMFPMVSSQDTTTYGAWTKCSKSCGGGKRSRSVTRCVEGSGCASDTETDYCNLEECPTDLCMSNPCSNDGICVSTLEDYACIFGPEFSGKHCECTIKQLNIQIVLDGSLSIGSENFNKAKDAINQLTQEIKNTSQSKFTVGLEMFPPGPYQYRLINLAGTNIDRSATASQINGIRFPNGNTSYTYKAINYIGKNRFGKKQTNDVLIVMTDGKSRGGTTILQETLQGQAFKSATIFVVNIDSDGIPQQELMLISGGREKNIFSLENIKSLSERLLDLSDSCSDDKGNASAQ